MSSNIYDMIRVYDYVTGFIYHVITDTLDNMGENNVIIMPYGQKLIDLMAHLKQTVDLNRSHIVSWYRYNILHKISTVSLMYIINQNRPHILQEPTTLQQIMETYVTVYYNTYEDNKILPFITRYYLDHNQPANQSIWCIYLFF